MSKIHFHKHIKPFIFLTISLGLILLIFLTQDRQKNNLSNYKEETVCIIIENDTLIESQSALNEENSDDLKKNLIISTKKFISLKYKTFTSISLNYINALTMSSLIMVFQSDLPPPTVSF